MVMVLFMNGKDASRPKLKLNSLKMNIILSNITKKRGSWLKGRIFWRNFLAETEFLSKILPKNGSKRGKRNTEFKIPEEYLKNFVIQKRKLLLLSLSYKKNRKIIKQNEPQVQKKNYFFPFRIPLFFNFLTEIPQILFSDFLAFF